MRQLLKNYRKAASQAAEAYYTETTEDALSKAVAARYSKSSITYPTEEYFNNQKREILQAKHQEALNKIQAAQSALHIELKSVSGKAERQHLRASSGITIAERYASQNNLDMDTAIKELNQYAETRLGAYGESLPDRYAAIRNRYKETTPEADKSKAWRYEEEEIQALGIKDTLEALKEAKWELQKNPGEYLKAWNTSGAALLRNLEAQEEAQE